VPSRYSRTRHTHIPRIRSSANYYGYGRQQTDGISGVSHPEILMTRQCGLWVRRDWQYGTRDQCDEVDRLSGGCCASGPMKPYLSVTATDAVADETGDTGTFTLTRTGRTDRPLTVYYVLSGTATNGADYAASPASPVSFAAGDTVRTVTITPVADAITEGSETVILTLMEDPVFSYDMPIGAGRYDTVTIADTSTGVEPD
jgi:hypothetical protein